ncbi:MAG: hypothetical protein IPI60_05520 [Saprospiraceae bacterium]|nr:hypothetical protein [Saprospiraceae bacterium]
MELVLARTYFPEATNGQLYEESRMISNTIELPWLANKRRISCIPEGRYQLVKRYSRRFKWHIELLNVPNRDLILMHAANDARKELLGCIAPVTKLTGIGKGSLSRAALERIKSIVYKALDAKEEVFLTIKKADPYEHH